MGFFVHWSQKEDRIIQAGWESSATDAELAALLPGRTETAVRKRRQYLGLTKQIQVVDRAELVRLDAEGLSSAEVAARLDCTPRTVQQLLYLERLKERNDAAPP